MPKEKPKHPLAFTVKDYDGFFRRLVHSEYRSFWYLCDLDFYGGNGKCNCPKFEREFEKQVRDEGKRIRCKHLRAARRQVGKELLDWALEQRAKLARKIKDGP